MSLQEKVLKLKMDAYLASRTAAFWQKAITEHGEEKATEFYKHLGLNHLERKSIEWDGLTLSREPNDHEKIAVKGVSQAQESAKESINKILLSLRTDLIADGLKGIKKLKPATYHELTLQASKESRTELRDRLIKVHRQGRLLVIAELVKGKTLEPDFSPIDQPILYFKDDEDEFDGIDTYTDLTDSRVANDVQSRIVAAAVRFSLLGLTGAALLNAIQDEMNAGSVSYIDRAAIGVGNKVLNIGRMDEMRNRADEIDRYEQSEILDQNTCPPCAADDGKTASNPDDLPGAPNPDCEGTDYCRGFIVAIAD